MDEQILELVEDETKIATEIEEAADFNERIYECMVKIDSILCLKQEKPDPVNQHPVLATTAGQSATKSTRLGKPSIPTHCTLSVKLTLRFLPPPPWS